MMQNNHYTSHINMEYKDKQGGGMVETSSNIYNSLTPDTLMKIRDALATGIARGLVYSAIQSLHIEDKEEIAV